MIALDIIVILWQLQAKLAHSWYLSSNLCYMLIQVHFYHR